MTRHLRERSESLADRPPVVVEPDATLREAARLLWLESVGALVVGDEREPLGVLSERDVTAQLGRGADPDRVTVADAMTANVISVRPGDPLLDAASLMLDDLIRHVPVVDADGTVIGMVSMRDVFGPVLLDALGG